jgi:hypothetical protein
MNKYILLLLVLLFNVVVLYSQLDETTVMGIPTGTTSQINNVTPLEQGAIAFNTDTKEIMVFNGTIWVNSNTFNETLTTITNTLAAGHKIADYTNEDGGTPVTINETVTSLTQDDTPTSTANPAVTGEITFTDENGNTTGKAQVVSADVDNAISVGADGGAYKAFKLFDGYDNTGGQTFNTTSTKLNLDTQRSNAGFAVLSNDEVTIPVNGIYQITYSVSYRLISQNTSNRTSARSELRVDNIPIIGSDTYTYHRINDANHPSISNRVSSQTGTRTLILTLTTGQKLSINGLRFEGTDTLSTIAGGTSITLHKLN